MQLNQLKPRYKKKSKKRIGRGGKRGTYSGRGMKGQRSRAGRRMKPAIRDWIKRYPKLKGYREKPKSEKPEIVNLEVLEKKFEGKETVSPQTLLEKGIIRKIKGRLPEVKVLGKGNVKKSLILEGCLVSKQAREKIEKANGSVK